MDWVGKIKDILSLGTRHIFIIAFIAWIILLVPEKISKFFSVDTLIANYRPWIAAIAILATLIIIAGLVFDFITWISNQLRGKWRSRQIRSEAIANLYKLAPEERAFLRYYIGEKQRTYVVSVDHHEANSLVAKGILKGPSEIDKREKWNYRFEIQPWAYDYLSEHPHLLDEQ
jgi:hypothetical protein